MNRHVSIHLFTIMLVAAGAGLFSAAAFILFSLLGATWDAWDAATFATLGGMTLGVAAMRRDSDV